MIKRLNSLSRALSSLEGAHLEIRVGPNSTSFKEIDTVRKQGYDFLTRAAFDK